MEEKNENHQLGTEFFLHHRIVSAVKTVEFVSWCNIVVLSVHAPTEEKRVYSTDGFMRN
jgi:hypothetical protein